MQTEIEIQSTEAEEDISELVRLIHKAGFTVEIEPGWNALPTEKKIELRYFLLATYYGVAAHYATVDFPLSHDYRQAVEASMRAGNSYQLPHFDSLEDRGLEKMLGDLAILKRDMGLVSEALQNEGIRAIRTIEFYLPYNQNRRIA